MTLQEHIRILSQNTGMSPLACMFLAVVKGAHPEPITWDRALTLSGADAAVWKDAVRAELADRQLFIESADGVSITATDGKAPDGTTDPSVGDLMSIDAIPTAENPQP
jgi:hypothetical protein